MRTLQELNELILEKYKTYKHTYTSICICLFVEGILNLPEEEYELWYNNFLNYKHGGPWWEWIQDTEKAINIRIEILTKIVEDNKLINY